MDDDDEHTHDTSLSFFFFSFRFHVKEMSLFGPNVKIKLREQHMYQMHHWGALCLRVCVCVCGWRER